MIRLLLLLLHLHVPLVLKPLEGHVVLVNHLPRRNVVAEVAEVLLILPAAHVELLVGVAVLLILEVFGEDAVDGVDAVVAARGLEVVHGARRLGEGLGVLDEQRRGEVVLEEHRIDPHAEPRVEELLARLDADRAARARHPFKRLREDGGRSVEVLRDALEELPHEELDLEARHLDLDLDHHVEEEGRERPRHVERGGGVEKRVEHMVGLVDGLQLSLDGRDVRAADGGTREHVEQLAVVGELVRDVGPVLRKGHVLRRAHGLGDARLRLLHHLAALGVVLRVGVGAQVHGHVLAARARELIQDGELRVDVVVALEVLNEDHCLEDGEVLGVVPDLDDAVGDVADCTERDRADEHGIALEDGREHVGALDAIVERVDEEVDVVERQVLVLLVLEQEPAEKNVREPEQLGRVLPHLLVLCVLDRGVEVEHGHGGLKPAQVADQVLGLLVRAVGGRERRGRVTGAAELGEHAQDALCALVELVVLVRLQLAPELMLLGGGLQLHQILLNSVELLLLTRGDEELRLRNVLQQGLARRVLHHQNVERGLHEVRVLVHDDVQEHVIDRLAGAREAEAGGVRDGLAENGLLVALLVVRQRKRALELGQHCPEREVASQ
mmetsp:Transcript_69147/g.193245  ORF Transcript_69147/g.193245 Transcript_69147/m.193245 type:complete len:612 (-) Transcript_69147:570-2405(-)